MLRKFPNVRLKILSVLFLVTILVGAQKSETVNGVRIIHNEKGGQWGANPAVKLELIRTIGGLDAEENLSFNNPNDIVQDSAGNLYILDTNNNRIQKLNSEGRYIKTIGRKGQGPGEFQAANSMDIDDEDNLFIYDLMSMRIEVLSSEGKPLRTIKFRSLLGSRLRLLEHGLIVKGGSLDSGVLMGTRKDVPKLLNVVDQNGRAKFDFGEATDYGDGNTTWNANQFVFDTDLEKNICLSFRRQNRIEKYAPDGRLLWRADRSLNYGTDVIEKGTIKRGKGIIVIRLSKM
jgi:DNA-binding beta-propeller fold protein YncE